MINALIILLNIVQLTTNHPSLNNINVHQKNDFTPTVPFRNYQLIDSTISWTSRSFYICKIKTFAVFYFRHPKWVKLQKNYWERLSLDFFNWAAWHSITINISKRRKCLQFFKLCDGKKRRSRPCEYVTKQFKLDLQNLITGHFI